MVWWYASPASALIRSRAGIRGGRRRCAAWCRRLAAARPDARILLAHPGSGADRSLRDEAVVRAGLGRDAAVLRDRFHHAAAPRPARDDAGRHRRDGGARTHGFKSIPSDPPNGAECRNRPGGDARRELCAPGTRRHDGASHVAGTGDSNRGRCCRVLPRQVRPRGCHRAARHQAAGQSIVADGLSAGLSELLHRGQPRGGTRGGDRPQELAHRAARGSAVVFRVPLLLGARPPARRRSPAPGGHPLLRSRHGRRRWQRADHPLGPRRRTYPRFSSRASDGRFARERGAGPRQNLSRAPSTRP